MSGVVLQVPRRALVPLRGGAGLAGVGHGSGSLPGWVVGAGIAALLAAGGVGATEATQASTPRPPVVACAPAAAVAGLTAEQRDNATRIIAVGQAVGVPPRGWVVALATAMQESRLRNINYGDRDSLGLFQQRPSQGWGTPAQVTDPTYAAKKFYSGLQRIPRWQELPVTVAAQAVQRSAFPSAYAKWEPMAAALVAGTTCETKK